MLTYMFNIDLKRSERNRSYKRFLINQKPFGEKRVKMYVLAYGMVMDILTLSGPGGGAQRPG